MFEAEQAGIRLLAIREHTRAELRRKLLRKHEAPDVEKALTALAEQGLQSDERYTELYIGFRRNKGYGPLRIRAELKEKGADAALIDKYLDQNDDNWYQLLKQVSEKKYAGQAPVSQRDLASRGRFLSYRGFPTHLISTYLFGE